MSIFVLNEPTNSCCGSTGACSCGGHIANEDKPTPMREVPWVFENEFMPKKQNFVVVGSSDQTQVRNEDKPTCMPVLKEVFVNEFMPRKN